MNRSPASIPLGTVLGAASARGQRPPPAQEDPAFGPSPVRDHRLEPACGMAVRRRPRDDPRARARNAGKERLHRVATASTCGNRKETIRSDQEDAEELVGVLLRGAGEALRGRIEPHRGMLRHERLLRRMQARSRQVLGARVPGNRRQSAGTCTLAVIARARAGRQALSGRVVSGFAGRSWTRAGGPTAGTRSDTSARFHGAALVAEGWRQGKKEGQNQVGDAPHSRAPGVSSFHVSTLVAAVLGVNLDRAGAGRPRTWRSQRRCSAGPRACRRGGNRLP